MQPRSFFAIVAALAISTAFASQSSGAGAGKVTTEKGTPMAPLAGTVKAPTTSSTIRINPQPLPPLASRAGGNPPTLIDRH